MSRPRKIALSVALLGVLVLLLKSPWRSESKQAEPSRQPPPNANAQWQQLRTHKEVNALARALSMVAANTLGLVRLQGRVLDRRTGEPIADAEVMFTGPSGESSAQCDKDGHFDIELVPGFYRSYAQAPGYLAVAPTMAQRLPETDLASSVAMPRASIAPLAGLFRNHKAVDFYLSAAATLQARVVDESGQRIAGAIVAAESDRQVQLLSGTDVSESDASGMATLQVPAGTIRFQAQHSDYAGAMPTTRVHLAPGEQAEVEVVLLRGCIVEGSVVHESGTPALEGAFERQLENGSYIPVAPIRGGKVRFTQLREGPLVLRAWPWKNPPTRDQHYACKQGSAFRNEVFVVPEAEPLLTGRVLDQEGQAAAFAFVDVFALEAGAGDQQERADESGEFEFFALAEGPYQISAFVAGKGAAVQLIDVPSTGVPLELGGIGALIGTIDWFERGTLTMRFRCEFPMSTPQAALRDAVSMPVQNIFVLVENHHFRIEDVPACPIRGQLESGDRRLPFSAQVKQNEDTVLHFE